MQFVAALSSSEVDATTDANTLKNAATISLINVFTPPTKPPTVPTEQTLVTPLKMGLPKDNKVTFRGYAQARKLKSVFKTIGDDEVNTVSFSISLLKILSKESQMGEPTVLIPNLDPPLDSGEDGLDLPGGGDPPDPTLELSVPMDADQWKNAIVKEMAIVKPGHDSSRQDNYFRLSTALY
jgi:hypothetical protein